MSDARRVRSVFQIISAELHPLLPARDDIHDRVGVEAGTRAYCVYRFVVHDLATDFALSPHSRKSIDL